MELPHNVLCTISGAVQLWEYSIVHMYIYCFCRNLNTIASRCCTHHLTLKYPVRQYDPSPPERGGKRSLGSRISMVSGDVSAVPCPSGKRRADPPLHSSSFFSSHLPEHEFFGLMIPACYIQ